MLHHLTSSSGVNKVLQGDPIHFRSRLGMQRRGYYHRIIWGGGCLKISPDRPRAESEVNTQQVAEGFVWLGPENLQGQRFQLLRENCSQCLILLIMKSFLHIKLELYSALLVRTRALGF